MDKAEIFDGVGQNLSPAALVAEALRQFLGLRRPRLAQLVEYDAGGFRSCRRHAPGAPLTASEQAKTLAGSARPHQQGRP